MFTSEVSRDSAEQMPEFKLWRAVIAIVVQEWVSGPLRLSREAEQYLFHDEKDFLTVCHAAGLNPSALRSRLTRLKQNGYGPADRCLAHA